MQKPSKHLRLPEALRIALIARREVAVSDSQPRYFKAPKLETGDIARRQLHRLYRIDLPILSIEGVALLLCISVQAARNIPASLLPRRKVGGKRFVYLLRDVLDYVAGAPERRANADELVREASNRLIASKPDSGRKP